MNARLRRTGHGVRVLLVSIAGAVAAAALLVGARTEITSLRYELHELRHEHARLRGEVEKLRVEAAALVAPERLEARARALGLVYPEPGQVLALPHSVARADARGVASGAGQ